MAAPWTERYSPDRQSKDQAGKSQECQCTDGEIGIEKAAQSAHVAWLGTTADRTSIADGPVDAPLPIFDWKGILGVVTPILVTTQYGQ